MPAKLTSAILVAASLAMAGCSHNPYQPQSTAQYEQHPHYGIHHRKGHSARHHSLSPSNSSLYIY